MRTNSLVEIQQITKEPVYLTHTMFNTELANADSFSIRHK